MERFTYADFIPKGFQRVSGKYGDNRGDHKHSGVDFAAQAGSDFHFPYGGTVTRLGNVGGYGNLAAIKLDNGYTLRVGHLQDFAPGLHVGSRLEPNQLVGHVGSTGRSSGPHAHFEIINPKGGFEDPLTFNRSLLGALQQAQAQATGAPTPDMNASPTYQPVGYMAPPTAYAQTPATQAYMTTDPMQVLQSVQDFRGYHAQPVYNDYRRIQEQYGQQMQALQQQAAMAAQPRHLGAGRTILSALLGAGLGGALGAIEGRAGEGALLGAGGMALGAYGANKRQNAARAATAPQYQKMINDLLVNQNTAMNDAVTREKGVKELTGMGTNAALINKAALDTNNPGMMISPDMTPSDAMTELYMNMHLLPPQIQEVIKAQLGAGAAGRNNALDPTQPQVVDIPHLGPVMAPGLNKVLTDNATGLAGQYNTGIEAGLKVQKQPYDLAQTEANTLNTNATRANTEAKTATEKAKLDYVNETDFAKKVRGLRDVYGDTPETNQMINDMINAEIYGKPPVPLEIERLAQAAYPNNPQAQQDLITSYAQKQVKQADPDKKAAIDAIKGAMLNYGFLNDLNEFKEPDPKSEPQRYQLYINMRNQYNRLIEGSVGSPDFSMKTTKVTPGKLQSKYMRGRGG